jgi:hypothetical protein
LAIINKEEINKETIYMYMAIAIYTQTQRHALIFEIVQETNSTSTRTQSTPPEFFETEIKRTMP